MVSVGIVTTVILLYILLLFVVAHYADQRRDQGRSIVANPNIYALSLAVYLTSWTFYGSVGRAATSGLDFLPIYLGPTLIAFGWWFLLRKMVRISKEHKIVSIADFISSRYGKSVSLGAIVTVFAVVGVMPYIALQLKAVAQTFDIITTPSSALAHGVQHHLSALPSFVDTALIAALLLGIFGMLFGARHLDASERHEGLIAAIAVESLVKLVAFLAVGIFVTFGLFDGFSDIFAQFNTRFPERTSLFLLNETGGTAFPTWFTLTTISMMAVMFLPRQFHVMVIENSHEEHIRQAMWRFPAYMFLITLFVIPIALGGLLYNNGDASFADYFVLQLPLQTGHPWLALIVYIGGFSAAAGMVMVESVTLSTMILNHLIIPLILRLGLGNRDLSKILIQIKRFGVLGVIGLGYLYYRAIGDVFALVNIGLASFVAASQFAPAMIGALYWKRANRLGVTAGLLLGFSIWFYTLLLPSFIQSGWLSNEILLHGPFGISLLRPTELFGLNGFDIWTHAFFWSMFFNLSAFLTLSLLTSQKRIEVEQADKFVEVFSPQPRPSQLTRLSKAPTIIEFVNLMSKFIGEKQAALAISNYLGNREINAQGKLADYEIPELKRFTERTLAGSVGAAPARVIVENYLATRGSHMEDVFDIFGSVTISRTSSREQLGVLYDVARVVGSGTSLQAIMDDVLTLLSQQFRIDLCAIRLYDPERNTLIVHSQRGITSDFGISERILSEDSYLGNAYLNNMVEVVNDTDHMDHPALVEAVKEEGITAFAHAPISVEGEPIGILSAYSKSAKGLFTAEFVELLKTVAGQISVAWHNSRLTDELITAKEQEKELEIAKNIQLGLLPNQTPQIGTGQLAGLCIPARQIGGDYYDYLQRNEHQLDLVIADVSGHNIAAALLMAETRAFIRAKTQSSQSPAEIVRAVNSFFYNDLSRAEMFITLFYARYDSRSGKLSYASAGHNPPLVWHELEQRCERLDAEGLILGIKPDVIFEEKELIMKMNDILLLYTDGLTEGENLAEELFGEDRLEELLREFHGFSPQIIVDRIMEQVRLFTGQRTFRDDVTMVVLKVGEESGEPTKSEAKQLSSLANV